MQTQSKKILRFVSPLMLIFGLIFIIAGFWLNQSILWFTVQGRVYNVYMENGKPLEDLAIEGNVIPSDGRPYKISEGRLVPLAQIPHVVYYYRVNEKLYSSDNIRYPTDSELTPEEAQAIKQQYSVNNKVTVYYNPFNPDTSYLEKNGEILFSNLAFLLLELYWFH